MVWAGSPLFARAAASVVNRSPNMFTLIALGIGAAYGYSVLATVAPGLFPLEFRDHADAVPLYFESAAVIDWTPTVLSVAVNRCTPASPAV